LCSTLKQFNIENRNDTLNQLLKTRLIEALNSNEVLEYFTAPGLDRKDFTLIKNKEKNFSYRQFFDYF